MQDIKKKLIRWKFRISYLTGTVTLAMVIVVGASTIQNKLALVGISLGYGIVLALVILGTIITSYIFDKFGLIETELNYATERQTLLTKMLRLKEEEK